MSHNSLTIHIIRIYVDWLVSFLRTHTFGICCWLIRFNMISKKGSMSESLGYTLSKSVGLGSLGS